MIQHSSYFRILRLLKFPLSQLEGHFILWNILYKIQDLSVSHYMPRYILNDFNLSVAKETAYLEALVSLAWEWPKLCRHICEMSVVQTLNQQFMNLCRLNHQSKISENRQKYNAFPVPRNNFPYFCIATLALLPITRMEL